ncbi:MAG: tetratricopeptide repeat protein [Saprospiraceae bacterium]|nr:tetratricopeptide repeat protein [Saprospiraceae bacterium]
MFKVIIQGKLDFGNERSFQKALQLYNQRLETLYKKELVFKLPEQLFAETDHTLIIQRFIGNISEKVWKNTISSLEHTAQFSISGSINCWMTDNGKILHHVHIEPLGEKSSVMLFQEGKKVMDEGGSKEEAIKLLSEVIEKYEKHSQAYERRGYVNFTLRNYEDALYDFKKSIGFDHMNASSWYGVGRCLMLKKEYSAAAEAFDETTKQSIALQPIYWAARRVKGMAHLQLKEFDKAATEFKYFTTRQYGKEDPNFKHLSNVWFNYGKALFAQGKIDEAIQAFDKSVALEINPNSGAKAEALMHRGLARKALGKADFILDIQLASEMGHEAATQLLTEIHLS